ncbi:MAG: hypothetical protein CSB47_02810 [Proteobacteria bacterium]|nr:MAG: hypothetical protein CSB47_02810 [Pseudomonadota bacterium]
MRRLFVVSIFPLLLFGSVLTAYAASSEMDGFNKRMRSMEIAVAKRAGNRPAQIAAYNALERALNMEMNRAFDLVMTRMKPSQRANMTEAQHLWTRHRDQEYRWMDRAHGPIEPGSVEHLRILELRNLMMNARVIQLYSYLDTLPRLDTVQRFVPKTNIDAIHDAETVDNNDLKVGTIIGFSLGDGACFLDLRDESRKNFTEVANAAFCQRERELLDKKVVLSYQLGVVSGATCAVERVDCDENNMVILVKDAKVIRPKRIKR